MYSALMRFMLLIVMRFFFRMMAHSYLNGHAVPWHLVEGSGADEAAVKREMAGGGPRRRLPSQLARPWCAVCRSLGLPPILTAALDLWNWKWRRTKTTAAGTVRVIAEGKTIIHENVQCISTMTGTESEVNFHMLPAAMHSVSGALLPRLFEASAPSTGALATSNNRRIRALLLEVLGDYLRIPVSFAVSV